MFKIINLNALVEEKVLFKDFNLQIEDGSIHVLMGKNGIGKSSLCKIIMKDKNYNVLSGDILYNNESLRNLETYEIARKGLFLLSQNPMMIEGVSNAEVLRTALREKTGNNINIYEFNKTLENACNELKLDSSFIHKDVNVGASGGERKKIELMHAAVLKPSFMILDEIDSGLDVDSLKDVTDYINKYHEKNKCSILIITHHTNILDYVTPDYVHILDDGKIIKTGDKNLAYEIEKNGFKGQVL